MKKFRLSWRVWILYLTVQLILLGLNAPWYFLTVYAGLGFFALACRDRRAFDRPEKKK